jgi:CubicO group peptidase (beta-lactamase class C family)
MQLNERGRISIEDPLVKYLPEFPYPDITLRQLMSHTSGLPDFQIFTGYGGGTKGRLTNVDLIPALKKWGKVVAPPGTRWSYSSVGIGLLALVVEKVSGVSFPRYVSENICQPAGMRNTYVNTLDSLKPDPLRAVAYVNPGPDSPGLTPADTVKSDSMNPFQTIVGPGLVVSTAPDLLLFDEALYTDKLLHSASLDEMFTPAKLSDGSPAQLEGAPLYAGLVWGIDIDDSSGTIVSHNGGNPGIATILMRNLKTHDTVIVLENTDNRSVLEFGLNAMNILLHRPPMAFGPMQGQPPGVRGGPPPG